MNKKNNRVNCPCGSGDAFIACCAPYIKQLKPAPTAEKLMRSRFTAYTLNDYSYIYSSWHPSTRPAQTTLQNDIATQWIRLKIIKSTHDTVEFKATYKLQGKAYHLHERSRFQFEQGRWYYVDGMMSPD